MKALTKLLSKLKLPHSWGGMQPARDWLILLALMLLAIIASVIWNVFFFTSALNNEAAPASADVQTSGTRSTLPALEELLEARTQEAARFENASFVDPSL